jgi:deazaflavin-dependent oxidoreductase (nitroreductase family)
MNDFNKGIIAEFRANAGKVGGRFAGAPMVLLTTTGAKSGQPHTTPLVCMPDGERIVVFASMGGAPRNPAWFHNLRTNADVTVEYGTDEFDARARITSGAERDDLFRRQVERFPQFGEYQKNTTRTIPVIVLERTG